MKQVVVALGLLMFASTTFAQVPTEVPTDTPTPPPTTTPTPVPGVQVVVDQSTVEPGEPIPVSGTVPYPNQPYTLCLVDNASWTAGQSIDCSICRSTTDFTPPGGTFSGIPLPGIPDLGEYDVLLLDGTCNGPLELISADDLGPGEGVVVAALFGVEIPELMVPAAVFLMGLLALTGWVILRRS